MTLTTAAAPVMSGPTGLSPKPWQTLRMRLSRCLRTLFAASLLSACSAKGGNSVTSSSGLNTGTCAAGSPLAGASYEMAKSRFAFGSTPSIDDAGTLVRWVGSDGVVGIFSDGSELASMNANAPEANLPDWSADSSKLAAHAVDYWASMGVATCQIAGSGIDGSAGGGGSADGGSTFVIAGSSTVTLSRAVHGIPVVESLAVARFDVDDQTTEEAFYWPEIPAEVVTAALAFQMQLSESGALAAYKAKLPPDAQGQGQVVIHHTNAGSSAPFQTVATYQVLQATPENDGGDLNFDQNGNPVTTLW